MLCIYIFLNLSIPFISTDDDDDDGGGGGGGSSSGCTPCCTGEENDDDECNASENCGNTCCMCSNDDDDCEDADDCDASDDCDDDCMYGSVFWMPVGTPMPTPMPTEMPTPSPTVFPLNLDIYQLITTGLGGRAFQTLQVTDSDWEDRVSQVESYTTMLSWRYNNVSLSFGGFMPRDESSPVFPNGIRPHPPLLDGFGAYPLVVGQGRGYLGQKNILNPVPDDKLICQNNFKKYVADDDYFDDCATDAECTCNAANDEAQIYGPSASFNDLAMQLDFCATGIRGGRGYLAWYSPTFNDGNFAHCPFECNSAAADFKATLTEPDFLSGAPGNGAVVDVCVGTNLGYLVTCTNKQNDDSDGANGRQWQTADVRIGQAAPSPYCCEPSCVGATDIGGAQGAGSCSEGDIVPTEICDINGCAGEFDDTCIDTDLTSTYARTHTCTAWR
jgi:hypothetical protein